MRALLLLIPSGIALAACGHAPTAAREVRLTEDPPPAGCERLGRVEAREATGFLSFQDASRRAEDELRREAASRGATLVHVDRREEPGVTTIVLGGVAYRCPSNP
jgi:hypothetical protein